LQVRLPNENTDEIIPNLKLFFQSRNPLTDLDQPDLELMTSETTPQVANNLLEPGAGDYEVNLADVLLLLKQLGYNLENCFISYYSPLFKSYVNCGLDPIPSSVKISRDDFGFKIPRSYQRRIVFQSYLRARR